MEPGRDARCWWREGLGVWGPQPPAPSPGGEGAFSYGIVGGLPLKRKHLSSKHMNETRTDAGEPSSRAFWLLTNFPLVTEA